MADSTCTSRTPYKDDIVVKWKPEVVEIVTADTEWLLQTKYLRNFHNRAHDLEYDETKIKTESYFLCA